MTEKTKKIKCGKCKVESDDFVIRRHLGTGERIIWLKSSDMPHMCKTEKVDDLVKCPKCDPLKRKPMPRSKLYQHLDKEHL